MLDFRYHALSLVAVFLALGIGIVLGSSLGDTVVSNANKDIANSLRGDLFRARASQHKAQAGLTQRERGLDAAFPLIARHELKGLTVAVVSSGDLPQDVQSDIRDAVQRAGGRLASVSVLTAPPGIGDLGAAVSRGFKALRSDDPRLRLLGRRIGESVVKAGRVFARLARRFPDRFSGDLVRADAVAFYRDPTADRSGATSQLEQGLVEGLRAEGNPVVGVETLDTDPSQVSFYANRGLSSVDNVDSAGGRIALVLALGGARGAFGYKKSADAPLPR